MSESIFGYPTILLSDGTREWVGGNAEDTDAEFQRIIRERLGDDAEEVYKALKDYWLDFYGYNPREEDNAEAESWRNYAMDVWNELQDEDQRKKYMQFVSKMGDRRFRDRLMKDGDISKIADTAILSLDQDFGIYWPDEDQTVTDEEIHAAVSRAVDKLYPERKD